MKTKHKWSSLGSSVFLLILTFATSAAMADEGDPPTRVARLAYVEGSVSLQPGGTDEWVDAPLNRPLTTGDAVWSDVNSRVELQLDGSLVRLSSRTSISFLNVADQVTQIQLTSGTLIVRVRRLDDDETYEIDTPNLALSLLQPGLYRVSVDDSGTMTTVAIRRGQGQVTGGGADFPVDAGQQVAFTGTDTLNAEAQPYGPGASPFDVWSANRDARWDHSVSANYVSPNVVGYTDLDDQGDWNSTPDYGYVWFPRRVQPGWAPYHYGHWAYIAPWGYTWVDDQPWGFAPFHYGRWISHNGAWGWVPSPPRQRNGEGYVRPVYAPALVAWVGAGAGVAWFALGPREVYVPSYPVSRAYVNNVNVSNTIVNRTVVNNIYNTTIIKNRNVDTNITYVNRGVRGAIAATTTQAFTSAQPVATHTVQFDPRTGRVQAFAPAAVPTRQAVLGLGRQGAPRPPPALQSRPVVARMAPPPPPPSFERRQQAIQQNGGRPLSMAAVRQIQPPVAQRPAQIRIAPLVINRPGADLNPRRNDSPPAQQPVNRAPPAVQATRPTQVTNPAFPQQHLPDQQQRPLPQQQERERQLAPQQQDQEARRQQQLEQQRQLVEQQRERQSQALRQQQAQQQERDRQQLDRQQQADQQRQQQLEQQQRQQQLEQQHQQQIQALQQQRAQEQVQRQQQQKPQQNSSTKPPAPRDDNPSKPKRDHAPDPDH